MTAITVAITPITFARHLSEAAGIEIHVKRDEHSHAGYASEPPGEQVPLGYGGSKVRKLRELLPVAAARGATDLITFGAAGSTHVLATAVHGRAAGLGVHAVMLAQWDTPVAREVLAATLAAGAQLHPAAGDFGALRRAFGVRRALRRAGRRPFLIAPGGTSREGVAGCVAAGEELRAQLAAGAVAAPDAIVCALGSGGLSAGIAVAMARATPPCRVIAVQARHGWATKPFLVRRWAKKLAAHRREGAIAAGLLDVVDGTGGGYGLPSDEAIRAAALLHADGIAADTTYVAKAAAWLLRHGRERGLRRAVLWGSFAPPPPELRCDIPHDLAAILLRPCLPP